VIIIASGIAIVTYLLNKNRCIMGNFKNLRVWQLAKELAVRIYKLTQKTAFLKDHGLKDQIQRAAVSIPSNIAEGDNLDTDKQSVRHFYIARGSTAELRTQLIISLEIGYISSQEFESFDTDCDKISAMLTTLIKHRLQ
jgi:four helix bundle protein